MDPLIIRQAGSAEAAAILGLLRAAFAEMEGRIDPPSSIHRLTAHEIGRQACDRWLWVALNGDRPVACLFGTESGDMLYLSKLAVETGYRGRGLARSLIGHAEAAARAGALPALQVQSRVELVENHAVFARLGFVKVAETAHPGYDRPTSLTFRKELR